MMMMFIMVLYRHTDTFLACIPINAPKCFSLLIFFCLFVVYNFIDVDIIRKKQILRAVFQTSEVLSSDNEN